MLARSHAMRSRPFFTSTSLRASGEAGGGDKGDEGYSTAMSGGTGLRRLLSAADAGDTSAVSAADSSIDSDSAANTLPPPRSDADSTSCLPAWSATLWPHCWLSGQHSELALLRPNTAPHTSFELSRPPGTRQQHT